MSNIALGPSGDLDLTGHRLNLVTGAAAIEQNVRVRLRFILGSWWLDEAQGVPYLEDILIKSPDMLLVESIFRETIESTPGISTVNSIDLDLDNTRTLTVTFTATTDTGEELTFEPFIIEI